tara:strand:+ start:192 stop:365 length:174 start_codon:yes stop_codon:yes gene_type:complete
LNYKPDSAAQLMYYALRYELEEFICSDKSKRWDLNTEESKAVEKWMKNRMKEIGKDL